jgi:isoleucyl-tRNA synthetase
MIIDDIQQIEYEFADYLMIEKKKYMPGMEDAPISLLARTTTPWTLPANMFAAVHEDSIYAVIFDTQEKEYVVLARSLMGRFLKNDDERYVVTYYIQ